MVGATDQSFYTCRPRVAAAQGGDRDIRVRYPRGNAMRIGHRPGRESITLEKLLFPVDV